MPNTGTLTARPRLDLGANVRVRVGVLDPDYPDLSIDGWAGTIILTNDERTYLLVSWDGNTLEHADATGKARSRQDDLAFEEMWLTEDDLLLDPSADCRKVTNRVGVY